MGDLEVSDDGYEVGSMLDETSLLNKEKERQALRAEVEAFLARGGKINMVPVDMRADPPRKPESNYGGQPI